MKDITQYFTDAAKANDISVVDLVEDAEVNGDDERERSGGRKRNRVKIKISRRSTDERVCKIIDNNNDMVDKTPSPFPKPKGSAKLNDETPIKATIGKVPRASRRKTYKEAASNELEVLAEVNLNHDAPESNRLGDNTHSKKDDTRAIKDTKGNNYQAGPPGNSKTVSRKASSKETESQNKKESTSVNNTAPSSLGLIPIVDLSDEDLPIEESNAFQILMSKKKSSKSLSPTQPSPEDTNLFPKRSEEQAQKLKKSKEKLTVLADKKGYSKRKLMELEEGEVIEKNIQSRIKLLTGDNKKDQDATVSPIPVNQKQSNSNLLNYFSKASLEMPKKNPNHTFVVKADVHVSEDSDISTIKKPVIRNKPHYERRKKKQNVDLSEIDSIKVIESGEISSKAQTQEKNTQQTEHRWSLRIKLQEDDKEKIKSSNDISSDEDEEIFTHPKKAKGKKSESDLDAKTSSRKNVKSSTGSSRPSLKRKKRTSTTEEDAIQTENSNKSTNSSTVRLTETESRTEFNTENLSALNEKSKENSISECENNSKRKPAEKLAPLFTKRRKPDPEVLERRRLFLLQSDIAESENKTTERQPAVTALPFPRISHITQSIDTNCNLPEEFRIPLKPEESYTPILDTKNYVYISNLSDEKLKPPAAKKLNKQSIETLISQMEEQCVGATKMWNRLTVAVKDHSNRKSPKTRNKRGKLIDNNDSTSKSHNMPAQDENSIWLQKYRPKTTHEVVGNEEAARKLKEWLDGWRATLKENDGNSSDEFYSSDSSNFENNLVAVLLGPHGSGKSASVYAVAEELGYMVLEMNASSRRTGKKLLKEFEEATKSHRIRKEQDVPLFKSMADSLLAKKVPQKSLIFLEDIDIIFEEDEGFISAAYQLATNTKRPIVMSCRNACPHLSKMAPQQNRIYFQNPIGSRVSTLFELIALAETGYRLSHDCLAELLEPGDLRKALLQLQYLLLSGPPELSASRPRVRNTLWCDLRYSIYKPAIKMSKSRKGKETTEVATTPNNTTDALTSISNKLDNIAVISTLVNIRDSAATMSPVNIQASLSLAEDYSLYSSWDSMSSDIAEWIERKTITSEHVNQDWIQYRSNIALKKQLNIDIDTALSQVTTSMLDRQIISLDYLSATRTICRAEETRFSTNGKRGQRFFHYLQGMKAPAVSLRPNILAAACKAFQEKASEDSK